MDDPFDEHTRFDIPQPAGEHVVPQDAADERPAIHTHSHPPCEPPPPKRPATPVRCSIRGRRITADFHLCKASTERLRRGIARQNHFASYFYESRHAHRPRHPRSVFRRLRHSGVVLSRHGSLRLVAVASRLVSLPGLPPRTHSRPGGGAHRLQSRQLHRLDDPLARGAAARAVPALERLLRQTDPAVLSVVHARPMHPDRQSHFVAPRTHELTRRGEHGPKCRRSGGVVSRRPAHAQRPDAPLRPRPRTHPARNDRARGGGPRLHIWPVGKHLQP